VPSQLGDEDTNATSINIKVPKSKSFDFICRKVVVDEKTVIKENESDIGASGYLHIKSAHLENKFDSRTDSESLHDRIQTILKCVPSPNDYITNNLQKTPSEVRS